MPAQEHVPLNVTPRYDDEGLRTHAPPAHVCRTCSDFDLGRLVPVSFCEPALAALDAEEEYYSDLYPDIEPPPHLISADAARWTP